MKVVGLVAVAVVVGLAVAVVVIIFIGIAIITRAYFELLVHSSISHIHTSSTPYFFIFLLKSRAGKSVSGNPSPGNPYMF